MKEIRSFYFSADGVFLTRVYFAAIQALEDKGVSVRDNHRLEISGLEKDLLTGAIAEEEYFNALSSISKAATPITQKTFLDYIRLNLGLLNLVKELGSKREVVLFSDYPKTWLEKLDRDGKLTSLFKRVIYLRDMGCGNLYGLVLDRLESDHQLKAGGCLWVDGDPLRTSMVIRRGIDAIIYVDERRLRRELRLRSIL